MLVVVFDARSVVVVFAFVSFASSPSNKSLGSPSIAACTGLITAVIAIITINEIITIL
jgi:hypothetical protein